MPQKETYLLFEIGENSQVSKLVWNGCHHPLELTTDDFSTLSKGFVLSSNFLHTLFLEFIPLDFRFCVFGKLYSSLS